MISCHSGIIYYYYVYIGIQFMLLSMLAFGTCNIYCEYNMLHFNTAYKHNDNLLENVIMHIK